MLVVVAERDSVDGGDGYWGYWRLREKIPESWDGALLRGAVTSPTESGVRWSDKRLEDAMSTANKEVSRRFTELFSSGDDVLAESVLSPDVVFHGTAGDGELCGLDAMKRFLASYRRAFPDARSTVQDQVAEGDKVVTRWRARGTHRGQLGPIASTGREFVMDGITIERIAGGRIAEVWVARDELGLLSQLGVVPQGEPETAAG
jgi:steroid delta-isomerase-like uncharacterized protein